MIQRIWHGWTSPENAAAYETLIRQAVFPGIATKAGEGFKGAELLRLPGNAEVEFMTILSFDTIDSIKQLTGEDTERAYIPEKGRALLSRWDERARHLELRVEQAS
jgi:antibiotic biosynthesis monooxygenase (ABM) superfamily enzyme